MDSLYQVRVHKAETDLSIDALRETLHLLAAERAPVLLSAKVRLRGTATSPPRRSAPARWSGCSLVRRRCCPCRAAWRCTKVPLPG